MRDQLLTSVINLAAPTVAAVVLTAHEVGAVWIAFGVYQVAIAVCRGYIALPGQMVIGERMRAGADEAIPSWRAMIGIPLVLAALTALSAVMISDTDVRSCLLILAPTLPVLLLLDCARHWAYALRRVDAPARASLVWAVMHLVALVVVAATGASAPMLLAAWAVPGVLAGLLLMIRLRSFGDHAVAVGAPARQRIFLAGDALAGQLAVFIVPAVAGIAATLSDVGVFQNSRLLFRPSNVLLNLLLVAGIPLVTASEDGPARLERTRSVAVRSVVFSIWMTVAGIVAYVVADAATSVELSWGSILFAGVESVVVCPYVIYALLATTMLRAGVLLGVRVMAVVVQIVGVLALARYGAGGLAAASLAGMMVPSIVVPWWATRMARRRHSVGVLQPSRASAA